MSNEDDNLDLTEKLQRKRDQVLKKLEAAQFVQRYGTPFDPTGAKTGSEIVSLRQQLDQARADAVEENKRNEWYAKEVLEWKRRASELAHWRTELAEAFRQDAEGTIRELARLAWIEDEKEKKASSALKDGPR